MITNNEKKASELFGNMQNLQDILYQNRFFSEEKIVEYIKESNAIENIDREPTQEEIKEFKRFLKLKKLTIKEIEKFLKIYQPDAVLRDKKGKEFNVIVGGRFCPEGDPNIKKRLEELIFDICECYITPAANHKKYEQLHPFTDGNGRSGRVLWYWQMCRMQKPIYTGFLRSYYYQTINF